MRQRLPLIFSVVTVACLLLQGSRSLAGTATYDFSTDPTTDPKIIIKGGTDPVWLSTGGNPGGFLALLYSINSTAEVVVFPDIDNGQTVKAFTFECDLRIGNAKGNNGRPADGFSISFARGNDPVLASLPDSAVASNMAVPGQPENGTSTGIAISFDTWSGNTLPDGPDIEGIIVRVDNKAVLKNPMPTRNGACDDPTSIQTGPYDGAFWDAGGDPQDPKAWVGLCWAHLKVELDDAGKLSVTYKNKAILDHVQTAYFPSAGRLVLAGRTGGANENTHFDNIKITTTPSIAPLLSKLKGLADGFVAELTDAAVSAVDSASVSVKLDGTAITGSTVTKTGPTTSINYLSPARLADASAHTFDVAFKDTKGTSYSVTRAFTVDSFVTRDTLFIEAEDADFGHGQYVKNKKVGMDGPYDGGAYKGLGSATDEGFDYHTNDNAGQAYRPDTGLAAGKENGTAGNDRGYFTVSSWWTLGWNDAGEWYNYTRDFPTQAKDYEVFGHLSSGGAAINIQIDQITAGQGQADAQQVKKLLGYFAPRRATAGWDSLEVFPLTDKDGNRVTLNLSGKVTLRATMLDGSNEDMDYFAFRPAVSPFLAGVQGSRTGFTAQLADVTGAAVDQKSIALKFDNAVVNPTSVTKSGSATKIVYTAPTLLVPATSHTVDVAFKDVNGKSYTGSSSFTLSYITEDTLFIEAEDVDFGHGQYVKNKKIGIDGPYDGGAYKDLGTADDEGFDWHTNGNAGQAYRPDTGIAAGKHNGSAGSDRGYFTVKDWWTLGWNDAGEWYNYTRDFPAKAQDYEVFGHLSSGGAPINIQIDQITAGLGQDDAQQVKKLLGYFRPGRATPGWDTLEVFQLTDAKGSPVTVNLGGKVTLRTTILPDSNSDQDYFAFRPKSAAPPAEIKIAYALSGNTLKLTWTGGGTLQQATAVTGPFAVVPNANAGTATVTTGKGNLFLRVKK